MRSRSDSARMTNYQTSQCQSGRRVRRHGDPAAPPLPQRCPSGSIWGGFRRSEPFHKFCSHAVRPSDNGLFGFLLRFRSVTGRSGHAPSLKPCQKPKILAPHGYRISGKALMADFRVTQFFMRNGLRANGLETKASKNSPPASASARVFPENYFFALEGLKGLQGQKRRAAAAFRLFSLCSAYFRFAEKFFCGRTNNQETKAQGGGSCHKGDRLRLLPSANVAFCRLLSLRVRKVFLRKFGGAPGQRALPDADGSRVRSPHRRGGNPTKAPKGGSRDGCATIR
jgi:hypothetical protein